MNRCALPAEREPLLPADSRTSAPILSFGTGRPVTCITAGLHGWETSAIAIAWELVDVLTKAAGEERLHSKIIVVPAGNPLGTVEMARHDPDSGLDLNRAFEVSGQSAGSPIVDTIRSLIAQTDFYIDIHSGSRGAYWPHVIVSRAEELEPAGRFGLHFAIVRNGSALTATHCARRYGADSFCLEAGGGFYIDHRLVSEGVVGVCSFLASHSLLEASTRRTNLEQLYSYDCRAILSNTNEGLFYAVKTLGDYVSEGEEIGYRITLKSWLREPVASPLPGQLIYIRTYPRVHEADTLCMLLSSGQEGTNEKVVNLFI